MVIERVKDEEFLLKLFLMLSIIDNIEVASNIDYNYILGFEQLDPEH